MVDAVLQHKVLWLWVPAFAWRKPGRRWEMLRRVGSFRLAGESFHRGAEFFGLHAADDPCFLCVELRLYRSDRRLVDQRLGAGDRRGWVLRQPFCELPRRR